MRLDDSDDLHSEDQRGGDFSAVGFGGSGGGLALTGMLIPFVFSRFGCGGLIVQGNVYFLFGVVGNIGAVVPPERLKRRRLCRAAV